MKKETMSTRAITKKSLKEFKVNNPKSEVKITQARELKDKEDSNGSTYQKGYYPSVYHANQRNNQGDTQVRLTLNFDDYTILKSKANDEGTTIGKLLINSFFERPLSKGASKNKYADYSEKDEQELLNKLKINYSL